MCMGTKPTLMLSMTMLSNGLSSTCVGVSPEGSTNRNGLLVLSEAKREVRAGGGVHGSLIVTGRADSDFKAPFQIVRWKYSLDGREKGTHSWHGMFGFLQLRRWGLLKGMCNLDVQRTVPSWLTRVFPELASLATSVVPELCAVLSVRYVVLSKLVRSVPPG
jgi:hypothetical protein